MSRSFALYFALTENVNGKLPFKVIASDAGLLTGPVQVSDMVWPLLLRNLTTCREHVEADHTQYVSMAERYEIVFDFSSYAGKTIELRNLERAGGIGVEDDFDNTDKVMRFVVGKGPLATPDTSVVPASLRQVPFPPSGSVINHKFRFHRHNGEWRINDIGFSDVNNRVLAKVPLNTVEIWELENRSDGWTHPIHIHLVDFRVISREGNRPVMPYESQGLKDVVWLGRGEKVLVEAHYAPVSQSPLHLLLETSLTIDSAKVGWRVHVPLPQSDP